MQEGNLTTSHDGNNAPVEANKVKAATFLFGVTSLAVFSGFGLTVARAKRSYALSNVSTNLHVEGSKLALKALAYGTALSVSGCGTLVAIVALALGVNNPKEFGTKMDSTLKIKKKKEKNTGSTC